MCKKSSTFAADFAFNIQMSAIGRYEKEDLQEALRVLRSGGIIVYPTDTVWGIGCDATNSEAVRKIYALKQREDSKSMLVLLDSAAKLDYYVDVPEAAQMLLDSVSPDREHEITSSPDEDEPAKPLTIIYPNARHLAPVQPGALRPTEKALGVHQREHQRTAHRPFLPRDKPGDTGRSGLCVPFPPRGRDTPPAQQHHQSEHGRNVPDYKAITQ